MTVKLETAPEQTDQGDPAPGQAADAGEAGHAGAGGEAGTPDPATTGQEAEQGAVTAAENLKEAVALENQTLGGIIETLDSYAINLGETHISLWSASLVILVILGVYFLARFGSKFSHWILGRMTGLDMTQKLLAEKLATIGVWALAILIGIDMLGIDLTALAVFSGAFGLAIGFGLQKTFGNLIAGIILLMDRSIKPGDVIAVSDQAGNSTFGQIRKIGIRAVSVTTRDKREYLIPNENLMVNQVENWSYSSKTVRMQVPVGVSYNCDLNRAEQLMLEAAMQVPRILNDPPPTVWLEAYGDSSVNFIVQCWITDPEEGIGNIRSQVLKNLWWLFQKNNIEIPFPQRDINIRGNEQFEQLVAAIAQRVDPKSE